MSKTALILSIVNLAGLVVIGILTFDGRQKIAYVDSVKLLSQYKGIESARRNLEARNAQWQANIDTLEAEVNKAIESYEASKGKATVNRLNFLI